MQPSSLLSLLYRYWFFGWLFRDVNRGSVIERAAAWRHNQDCARWLPTYLRRWMVFGSTTYVLGLAVDSILPPLLQLLIYVPVAVSIPIWVVTLVAWLGLKILPGPF